MKLTNHLRRVLAATLFGLGCHTAALHAQNIMLHLDAPQGIDAQTLAADIGTLKITFSNSKDFFDTSLYAANTLDLGSDYYNEGGSSKDKYHKYYSRNLTLNADDGNGNAWWGNTNKIEFKFDNLRRYVSGRTDQPIYYRIYSPHFSRIITGQIDPTDAEEVTLHHTELTQARRVAFMPPVGRDGNAVPAILAPDLRTGACRNSSSGRVNMHDLTEPFARYVYKGDTLRYLVAPESSELALHADSIVVADTTTCVTTDYRKAVECRFYIADSQGQLCPVTNGELASVYYKPQPGAKGKGNYHGYGCYNLGGIFLNTLTAPDGTHAAYVLPGRQTFQLRMPTVQTTDPDFLMPYNADLGYILGEVTIPASTEPVSLSIAKSKPLRVTTTLADAAPYADHLQFSAHTYVNPPYSWQENKQMSVECKEVSRQVKGNDLVVTTLVEGSTTYLSLALNAQYGAQSDTIASVLSNQCSVYGLFGTPRTELTQDDFHFDGAKLPPFSKLHPVKFIVPCHLLQQGEKLYIHGQFGDDWYSTRCSAFATHHEGCAKSLNPGTATPVPYDTLTVILPEGNHEWYVCKNFTPYDSANIHTFTLGATDTLTQTIYDREFALLRVNCLGTDSIYVYNNVLEYHRYRLSKFTKGRLYYADEEIPLSPGYNERIITWREAKLQKDTLYSLSYWLEAPITYVDEDGSYYTSYHYFSRPDNYFWLEKLETATPDSAICISTGSKANLAVCTGRMFDPARFFTISPSEADTTVTVYTQKTVRVNFSYKGGRVPGFERLNMCYGNEQTHIVPNSNFYRRSRMDLEPGHYTMSGVVAYEDDATGEYVLTPFSIAFDIEANTPTTIELCPDPTAIAAAPANSAPAKAAACYAPDGRRISTPQPGLNIIKMTDGTVRKVMVK
ncbi:hypothetical protein [Prevotellamassilia timonensis]|uniref:hypothetical protein n=1 Tax=Prevotellamassilia timonensis TaxID=1852370 RepID=UPI0023F3F5BC|nr:hypothetical protein [Prevotellamassilia timonensis]MDD7439572.1 hypothetical protein [Prevotellamassilia timonensis]